MRYLLKVGNVAKSPSDRPLLAFYPGEHDGAFASCIRKCEQHQWRVRGCDHLNVPLGRDRFEQLHEELKPLWMEAILDFLDQENATRLRREDGHEFAQKPKCSIRQAPSGNPGPVLLDRASLGRDGVPYSSRPSLSAFRFARRFRASARSISATRS